MYHTATLLNNDTLLAYNRQEGDKDVVAVMDVDRVLEGKVHTSEIVLETGCEA